LAARLTQEEDASIRRALILALGTYDLDRLPPAERDRLVPQLARIFEDDSDPGVHGAAEWCLRQWGHQADLEKVDVKLATGQAEGRRNWYVSKQGQTFAIVNEPDRYRIEAADGRPAIRVDHRFAIAYKEVTVDDFSRFDSSHHSDRKMAPTGDCPVNEVSWYLAAEYCNWLSKQEGIPKAQWCYLPNSEGKYASGMRIAEGFVKLGGYRLPTDAEWELAARAGTDTPWSCGNGDLELLAYYAWSNRNSFTVSGLRCSSVGTLKPNDLGLFDMHGNALEWCQDRFQSKGPEGVHAPEEVKDGERRSARGGSAIDQAADVSSARRFPLVPQFAKGRFHGFRPARSVR
jgi:formylglycine-generating enzyme required for sulfatase activity